MKKTLTILLTLCLMLAAIPAELVGTGIPKNNGTKIDLEATINADGTGSYTFIQGSYRESQPIQISAEDQSFIVVPDAGESAPIGSAKGICPNCHTEIIFEKSAALGREYGITDNVVVCSKCYKVYEVELVPGKMTLTKDVSDKYPNVKPKKQGFFSKLFKK